MKDLNECIKKIEDALSHEVSDVELVSDTNNIVIKYKIDNNVYFAKFYQDKSVHVDNEVMLYEKLPQEGKKYLKKLIYSNFSTNDESKFAIFEEVNGRNLSEMLQKNEISDEMADKIAKEILNYFNIVSKIKTKKYGNLDNSLEGKYEEYLKYLYEYQTATTETLFLNKKTRMLSSIPYRLLEENAEFLDEGYSCVTPIDSNFNVIILANCL